VRTRPSRAPNKEPSSARRLVEHGRRHLPRADTEFLLTHLLGVPRYELYSGAQATSVQQRRFSRMVAQARAGMPVQYVVRSAPFLDFDVYVDHRVLIPRPETEELVERALARLGSKAKDRLLVVDYGTGSGCIAIALARRLPKARVVAVDVSAPALAVAKRNVQSFCVDQRVRLVRATGLGSPALSRLRGRADLLISNPPYVPTPRIARLDRRVRKHEPRSGLDGGPKGTSIVGMLLEHGPGLLRPGGLLALEIDWSHGRFVRRHAPAAEIEQDLAGRTRYVFLRKEE